MEQVWRDLLFAHWPIAGERLRSLVPKQLAIDTYQGQAWISIAPFHMAVRLRGVPVLPGMAAIPELNFRTYVLVDHKPGIYFFSLDTTSHLAVWGARLFYHLPYFHSHMSVARDGARVSYGLRRGTISWRADYTPDGPIRNAERGSLEYWLSERYCLYTIHGGNLYRGEIHHDPWPLQNVTLDLFENTVGESIGLRLQGAPSFSSFAGELDVLLWPLERVKAK